MVRHCGSAPSAASTSSMTAGRRRGEKWTGVCGCMSPNRHSPPSTCSESSTTTSTTHTPRHPVPTLPMRRSRASFPPEASGVPTVDESVDSHRLSESRRQCRAAAAAAAGPLASGVRLPEPRPGPGLARPSPDQGPPVHPEGFGRRCAS